MSIEDFGFVKDEGDLGFVADQAGKSAVEDFGFQPDQPAKPELSMEAALAAEKQQIQQARMDRLATAKKEEAFQGFYSQIAKANKLDPNPDAPNNRYDFRSYFDAVSAGQAQPPQMRPDKKQFALPEDFTQPGHPDYYVKTDPETWTMEQANKYVKDHPAQSPEQEAQYKVFIDQKKAQAAELEARLTGYDKYVRDQANKQIAAKQEYPHENLLQDPAKLSAFESFMIPYTKGTAGFFTRIVGIEPLKGVYSPEEIAQSQKDHPLANAFGKAAGGLGPMATAVATSGESLLSQVFAFGASGTASAIGAEKMQGSLMDQKASQDRIVKQTIKSAAYAPLWFFTKAITLGGPLWSIGTRALARGAGGAGIEASGGAPAKEAVMSGLMTGALSGMFELTPFAIEKINTSVKNKSIDNIAGMLVKDDPEFRNQGIQGFLAKNGRAPTEQELVDHARAALRVEVVQNNIPTSKIVYNEMRLKKAFEPVTPEIVEFHAGIPAPKFEPGQYVRAGEITGKLSKIVGENAFVVNTLGQEIQVALSDIHKDILPQEIPDKYLKKVPEEKKDFLRQLYRVENPAVIDELIHSDPHVQEAIARNKELGNKIFIESDNHEVWPEHYQKYIDEAFRNDIPVPKGQPEVILWLGFPGSGKSMLSKQLGVDKTHVLVDPDHAKEYIPETKQDPILAPHVQLESAFMAEELLAKKLIAAGKNIIWPKLGKGEKTLTGIMQMFRDKGYRVVTNYNRIAKVESKKRAYKRFLEEKRWVPIDYIDSIPDLQIEKVYDKIKMEGDQYNAFDVNVKFDTPPESLEKGVTDAEAKYRSEQTQALQGPGGSELLPHGQGPASGTGQENLPTASSQEVIPPQEVSPEIPQDPFIAEYDSMPPEDRAKFDLEMDDLRKTPEGNLFVAIKTLGGVRPYRDQFLKEELQGVPFYLKRAKGSALDELVSELKTFGWHFDSSDELLEAIKNQAANPTIKVDRASLQQIIKEAEKNKALQAEIEAKMGKRRKFITTVKDAEKTAPEVADKIESRYEPITNNETLRQAQEYVKANYNEAVEFVEGPSRGSAFLNTVGIVLMDKAQAEGRFADAVRIAERVAEKQTALGQAIQALSMYARLSPEGILQLAVKQVRKARAELPQQQKVTNFEKAAKGKTPAEIDALADKFKVPHISEIVAKQLREMAENIQKMPSIDDWPDFQNVPPRWAYQFMLDIQKTLPEMGEAAAPIRNAIQHVFDAFRGAGVTGENVPWSREEQSAFEEWKKTGKVPDTGENVPWTKEAQDAWRIGLGQMSRARKIEVALMLKKVADQVPPELGKKIATIQYIAQLLNPKTVVRNTLGNIGFLALENIADTIGTGLDIATSLRTGKRTVFLPRLGIQFGGYVQGTAEEFQETRLGINLKDTSKYSLPRNGVFDKGVLGFLDKFLRFVISDRPAYQMTFNQTIYQETKNSGIAEPTPEMIEKANAIALYRTFHDDNRISHFTTGLKRLFNANKEWGFGNAVINYPGVPGSIIHHAIEYSPFGVIKTIFSLGKPLFGKQINRALNKQVIDEEFDQEEFVRSASRAATGTVSLIATGVILAGLGIITGRRSKDKDVAGTRENVGIKEYQMNISALKRYIASGLDPEAAKFREDDALRSYDWFLPASIGVALGANLVLNPKENALQKALNLGDRVAQSLETIQEQPLVQGIRTMASKRNLGEGILDVFQGIPASFVPTLLNQVRQLTDNTARNTKDPNWFAEMGKKAMVRVPGLSTLLPERIDSLGRPKEMYQLGSNNPFNVFLNPSFANTYKPDPVSKMVLDLWESTGQTIQFPRVADARIKLGKETPEPVELSPGKYMEYQKYIGNKTNVLFTILAETPEFMQLSDDDKAKKLQGYLTDINTAAKIEVLGYRPQKYSNDVVSIIKLIAEDKQKIDAVSKTKEDFGFIPD